ncbi:phosphoribosylformylglycinamidine synthase subunit PurQ [bacterium]|nr:phosphoribosylformylglycinamidine synthase subunit PurQ [bacterium]
MRISIIEFPGSYGAAEALHSFKTVLGLDARIIDHGAQGLEQPEVVILPGGAAYGDFLRPGCLAKVSPIAMPLRRFAREGGRIFGFGNGFQILCEMGLLPGAFLPNQGLSRFIGNASLKSAASVYAGGASKLASDLTFKLPVSASHAAYYVSSRALQELKEDKMIVLQYTNKHGEVDPKQAFLGSVESIAGVCNKQGNILGLIPQPERAVEEIMGSLEGKRFLDLALS